MKKLKEKNITTFLVGMILGIVIAAATSAGAAILYQSSQVSYSNSSSGLSSTNVQGAIDELSNKTNSWINPGYIDFGSITSTSAGTILASKKGVCIKKDGIIGCFKTNNYSEELARIKQLYPDMNCSTTGNYSECNAEDFGFELGQSGYIDCFDYSGGGTCSVGVTFANCFD